MTSPVSCPRADEELGPVGVGTSVGHGQDSHPRVLQLEVLISKLLSVNGFASGSVVVGEISALGEEEEITNISDRTT